MAVAVRPLLSLAASRAAVAADRRAGAAALPFLIVNPSSFRAGRGLGSMAIDLARRHGADAVSVGDASSIADAVRACLAGGHERLVVLAGDGTVQAVVDALADAPTGAALPELVLLPGGRSNLSAADLMPRGDAMRVLAQALGASSGATAVVERTALRIAQAGAMPRQGFFLAGALVDGVIRRVHARRAEGAGRWRQGDLGTAAHLLALGARALAGRSALASPSLDVDAEGLGRFAGPTRLLLATTLHRPHGAADPYARRGDGPLRVTVVRRDADRFWRALPRLVAGRFTPSMDVAHGYLSGRTRRLVVRGLDGYSLDGEAFACDPGEPLVIDEGSTLRFRVPASTP